jgi:hypothetical protein
MIITILLDDFIVFGLLMRREFRDVLIHHHPVEFSSLWTPSNDTSVKPVLDVVRESFHSTILTIFRRVKLSIFEEAKTRERLNLLHGTTEVGVLHTINLNFITMRIKLTVFI